MKQNKKVIFILSLAVTFTMLFSLFAVGLMRDGDVTTTLGETERTPVVIRPPDTTPSSGGEGADTQAPSQTPTPRPYEGKTFTVLCTFDGERPLGDVDASAPNVISQASYERNLRICEQFGVEMVFRYTSDVFSDVSSSVQSGDGAVCDILNINMKTDGASFLMKGGLYDMLLSDINLESGAYDSDFIEYFTFSDRCSFLFGAANPSLYSSVYGMHVRESSTAVPALDRLISEGTFTLEKVLTALSESKAALSLEEGSMHTLLLGEPLFGFADGEPTVNIQSYTDAYKALLGYKDSIKAYDGGADIYISHTFDKKAGYKAYPCPTLSGRTPVDMARVYAFSVPANIDKDDTERVFTLTDALYRESVGIYDGVYSGSFAEKGRVYCFYGIFGWGDFSEHAYSSFLAGESAEKLADGLAAPVTVSRQALGILLERYK